MIGDVRGVGLFVGVDLVKDNTDGTRDPNPKAARHILSRMKEEKILLQSDGPHNNVLKFFLQRWHSESDPSCSRKWNYSRITMWIACLALGEVDRRGAIMAWFIFLKFP